MRTQFHSAVSIKNTIFRNETSCCLVYEYAIIFWKSTVNHLHEILDSKAADYFETFCLSIKFYGPKPAKTFLSLSSDMQNEFRERYSAVP